MHLSLMSADYNRPYQQCQHYSECYKPCRSQRGMQRILILLTIILMTLFTGEVRNGLRRFSYIRSWPTQNIAFLERLAISR